jgi:hypothetical protein
VSDPMGEALDRETKKIVEDVWLAVKAFVAYMRANPGQGPDPTRLDAALRLDKAIKLFGRRYAALICQDAIASVRTLDQDPATRSPDNRVRLHVLTNMLDSLLPETDDSRRLYAQAEDQAG